MAGDQDSASKTEKPTPRRLREARKKGDVAKSRDVTSTLCLAFALALATWLLGDSIERLTALTENVLRISDGSFDARLTALSEEALDTFLSLLALILLPIAAFGLLVEFMQTGPVFAPDKLKFKASNIDPVAGAGRVFSRDNVVELAKSIGKTVLVALVILLVVRAALDELVLLPANGLLHLLGMTQYLLLLVVAWTLALFVPFALVDVAWQKHSYIEKMKMSLRDVRDERKNTDGDPQVKNQRRQLHKEWSAQGATGAARAATVLVVNPTHVAIAIRFDQTDCPVPTVMAKGEEEQARDMREAADGASVPVLRNEHLARTLLADVAVGDPIPEALFDIVAEVILWATRTNAHLSHEKGDAPQPPVDAPIPPAPGEDLTAYPGQATLHL